ncbi:MAG: DUF3683 domain-containing protein [Desulfobacterales bacterium]|nr:DUF3683 domain-containing protein [Desulfobacterales bacterium]MDD4393847.1 DUF3683 domain-containing protein [Desulfobacterales bacterium]
MNTKNLREIPFNYTSADDRQIIRHLLGQDIWHMLERLRFQRRTGRSARLLMRIIGDMFILRRNPYVFQELVDSPGKHRRFFREIKDDLHVVECKADGNADVIEIISRCRQYTANLEVRLAGIKKRRHLIRQSLAAVVGMENVFDDPFTLISHATDATDWRLYLPVAVVFPTGELQVALLLTAIEKLGLHAIARGAGTGLTGGSVPVKPDCVIINTEKLNHIHGITPHEFEMPDGRVIPSPVIHLEAGVITESAMNYAARQNLVFATDPTSCWACTIGGNIAENAGGKTAVLWGTAIDNLLSFLISIPGGIRWQVRRRHHPLRKILPDDRVVFDVLDEPGNRVRTIELSGTEIRKKGLGKDITNKALKGLPGVQKEGTDGVITSAEFILHQAYPLKTTFCLEFFGSDMEEASRVIRDISAAFVNQGEEALMALEHFDEEYVRAIDYKTKAPKRERPKAVLLIDMVAHTRPQLDAGRLSLESLLKPYPNTYMFVAKDNAEAVRFWQDRKKLGAIAARTHAFKLNEDIVLPLDKLGEFAGFVDDRNCEENRYNQKSVVWQLGAFLEKAQPEEDPQWLADKLPRARQLLLDAIDRITLAGKQPLRDETHVKAVLKDLLELFRGYNRVSREIQEFYRDIRSCLIVIATHMHAGDGNVHVNIPVFSNNRDMMNQAAETADAVMAKAVELGGVVSGEHGIGFTKLKYLEQSRIDELTAYRAIIDPKGLMNPGKLSDHDVPDEVFTPSHELLGLEARILQYFRLEELAEKISKCMRCGRCKSSCCVFYPEQNLFAHPRNKNLAIRALIEAILYNSQRFQSTKFDFLEYLEDIADHCTICHKCLAPCPVNIDTGEVSVLERDILKRLNFKHTAFPTWLSLRYLDSRSELLNSMFRKTVLGWGVSLQRMGSRVFSALPVASSRKKGKVAHLLSSPIPRPSSGTLWYILPPCPPNQAVLINPPNAFLHTVFYFPGCGSERLYSEISKAALYILLKTGTRVVLPPPFICCGFPARVNAAASLYERQVLRDTIIFNQIRNMFAYLEFDACVVSCGTCREALQQMGVETIFGCGVEDVSRFALEKGLQLQNGRSCLYHTPCHDSLDSAAPGLLETYGRYDVSLVDHCCSESGTLALSRPDIASAMRIRKADAISGARKPSGETTVMLTNCPSCLQGLGRNADLNIQPRHIAEELAINAGGLMWESELRYMLREADTVLF